MRLERLYLACFLQLAVGGAASFVAPLRSTPERAAAISAVSTPFVVSSNKHKNSPLRLQAVEDATITTAAKDKPNDLLMDAIGYNVTAASTLLDEISSMREKGSSSQEEEDTTTFLNGILTTGPDSKLPFWSRSKRMARCSRRARLASLRRTLDITTPPPSESASANDTPEQKLQRRRRALLTLLRSLSTMERENATTNVPAIVALEKKAMSASKEDLEEDLRSRLPEGLETPDYTVISSNKLKTTTSNNKRNGRGSNVEIREYKPYSVCAVSMIKPRPAIKQQTDAKLQMPEMSGASSFGALAGYLFGKNDKSTAMKMTTPVFTTSPAAAAAAGSAKKSSSSSDEDDDRQMEFVLPSNYWKDGGLTLAPQPLDGSGVTLQQKESDKRAVLMFGGYASRKEVEKRKQQLLGGLAKDFPSWGVNDKDEDATSTFTLAQYNDPFTVPWRRLNEVSVQVVAKEE